MSSTIHASEPAAEPAGPALRPKKPASRLRWVVCGLLFAATVLNYLDRYALGYLAPQLKLQFHWTAEEYGWVLFAFQATYAFMNLPWGALMDRIGLRLGFFIAVVWWSLASMGHAFARSVVGFGVWRALLGIGEAGNFPGAVKSIAEWFPQRERATATGFLNAGANVGAMIAPLILFVLVKLFGWQAAFVATGALGFLWAGAWWAIYRAPEHHPRLSEAERAWILQDDRHGEPPPPRIPWQRLIRERRAWAFILGKAFSDPVWGFFLFWLPTFLSDVHHVSDVMRTWIIAGLYLAADVGSIGGGWMSSFLIHRGWAVNRARKTTMLATAVLVPLVALIAVNDNLWLAVGLIGIALSMHQWFSSNLFTTTSDMFPKEAIGTVVGMGQIAGSGVAMITQPLIGRCYDHFHSYAPVFLVAACCYPMAWICLHTLAPKLDRVQVQPAGG
jgi:ACS family hexuronate transporter-like MFS transporter